MHWLVYVQSDAADVNHAGQQLPMAIIAHLLRRR